MLSDGVNLIHGTHILNLAVPTSATAPSGLVSGELYYNTTNSTLYVFDGTSWVFVSGPSSTGGPWAPLNDPVFTGNVTLNHDPTQSLHAVTKQYVDAYLNGITWKAPVKGATTANLASLHSELTIDGVSFFAGDRILVKDQTNNAENGIYIVSTGFWTRSEDMNALSPVDEINGAAVYVLNGMANGDRAFTVTTTVVTIGTSGIDWAQFTGTSDPTKAPIANPTFTGTVTLAQDPTTALQAATKQYVDARTFYDISGSIVGIPANSEVALRFLSVRALTLPAGLTGSLASTSATATSTTTLTIAKNGTSIGSINFAAGSASGTFTFAAQVSLAAGDILTVTNQATADATFGNAQFTFIASY